MHQPTQHTITGRSVRLLAALALALLCTACERNTAAQEAQRASECIEAQHRLDQLYGQIADLRARAQRVPVEYRAQLLGEIDALESHWRQAQRDLVEMGQDSGPDDSGKANASLPTHPQEPLSWKKSG